MFSTFEKWEVMSFRKKGGGGKYTLVEGQRKDLQG